MIVWTQSVVKRCFDYHSHDNSQLKETATISNENELASTHPNQTSGPLQLLFNSLTTRWAALTAPSMSPGLLKSLSVPAKYIMKCSDVVSDFPPICPLPSKGHSGEAKAVLGSGWLPTAIGFGLSLIPSTRGHCFTTACE
mmetsp:Transcript_10377/g.22217  ORF Transcript_10377/g.22217 Transcript_10377/m.22217 type:complete len:140 (+) Transcript_10377:566-985(+)